MYALFEENMIHTDGLTKESAEEMLERYTSTYPDIDFYIMELPEDHEFPKH